MQIGLMHEAISWRSSLLLESNDRRHLNCSDSGKPLSLTVIRTFTCGWEVYFSRCQCALVVGWNPAVSVQPVTGSQVMRSYLKKATTERGKDHALILILAFFPFNFLDISKFCR